MNKLNLSFANRKKDVHIIKCQELSSVRDVRKVTKSVCTNATAVTKRTNLSKGALFLNVRIVEESRKDSMSIIALDPLIESDVLEEDGKIYLSPNDGNNNKYEISE
ncbi:1577_t:CDS:2, partial [Acaulospora colombiana]